MPLISASAAIDVPLDELWDLWTDVRRLPELSASTVAVTGAPDRLRRPGERFHQVLSGFGRDLEIDWTVEEIERGSHLVVASRPVPGVRVRLTERVRALAPDRTEATLDIEYRLPFGPAGRLAARLGIEQRARREAAEVVEGLRRLALATA